MPNATATTTDLTLDLVMDFGDPPAYLALVAFDDALIEHDTIEHVWDLSLDDLAV